MATATADATTLEVTDVLQHLIRNACVDDGSAESGHEVRSADLLSTYREGPAPGRTSLVARIEGTDPSAPTLLLMGHTDVVPANPEGWRHHPFGMACLGLFSTDMSFEDYGSMFHGDDERIDVGSLALSTQLWDALARDLLEG